MNKTYSAVYHPSSGRFYNSTILLSSITLSIRYTDERNEVRDVYWLAENILSLEENASNAVLHYKNKDGLTERLVIHDSEFVQAIKKHFSHHRFVGGWKHHVLGNTRNKIVLFISTLLALILVGYFWFMPWLGERIARNVSKEWEITIGEKMHQSIISGYKIDSSRTKLINLFFRELHYDLQYPVSITVVDSKEMNAFAVPGGHIVVYRSILDQLKEPEELAALLSHEASHIELRHSLRNIFRSMARKMFLMMIVGNESGLAGFLVDNADNLKGLEYSRSLETEADNHAIALLHSVKIDPTGMLGLMEILQKETEGKEPAAFLSTHPIFKRRIENIKNQIKKSHIEVKKTVLSDSIFLKLKKPGANSNW
jgi:Zn-dependent protease with chaperone function